MGFAGITVLHVPTIHDRKKKKHQLNDFKLGVMLINQPVVVHSLAQIPYGTVGLLAVTSSASLDSRHLVTFLLLVTFRSERHAMITTSIKRECYKYVSSSSSPGRS